MGMATKNISITEEAYFLLLRKKMRENESFSEIITREFSNKEKLTKLFGMLKGKAGEEFEDNLNKIRKAREIADKKRAMRIKSLLTE